MLDGYYSKYEGSSCVASLDRHFTVFAKAGVLCGEADTHMLRMNWSFLARGKEDRHLAVRGASHLDLDIVQNAQPRTACQ